MKERKNELLANLIKGQRCGNHPLYVLTKEELNFIQGNTIHLTDFNRYSERLGNKVVSRTSYNVKHVGANVKGAFTKSSPWNHTNLSKVKKNFIAIVVDINEQMVKDKNLLFIGLSSEVTEGAVVLLMLAQCGRTLTNDSQELTDDELIKLFKRNRKSIAIPKKNTRNHFGTEGQVFGCGFVAKYDFTNYPFSFGKYATKKIKGYDFDEVLIQKTMSKFMSDALNQLERILPHLPKWILLQPETIQSYLRSLDKKFKTKLFNKMNKYISSQLNVNVRTKYSHTEMDGSFTIIHVPVQDYKKNEFYFKFDINKSKSLNISLRHNVTILYTAYLLTHSQRCSGTNYGREKFINVSSYLSHRLIRNIKTSIKRLNYNK